eukprot:358829-Chlamydomonas_euryale.AAC.4
MPCHAMPCTCAWRPRTTRDACATLVADADNMSVNTKRTARVPCVWMMIWCVCAVGRCACKRKSASGRSCAEG